MDFIDRWNSIITMRTEQRKRNYEELCGEVLEGNVKLLASDMRGLVRQMRIERKDANHDAWRALAELAYAGQISAPAAISGATSRLPADRPLATPGRVTPPPKDLANWIMEPFRRPSVLHYIKDPSGRMRDELAMIELGFNVPDPYRKEINVRRAPLGAFSPTADEFGQVDTVAFIGRLGLYGPSISKDWGMKTSRFRFVSEVRPPDLKEGMLDTERYHRILADIGPCGETRQYCTEQNGEVRIDYGLIRRYLVEVNDHSYFVLHVAGMSAPGSLAGARWVIRLFSENKVTGPIPLPAKVESTSVLEAVVKATAKKPAGQESWTILNTQLVELYLDDQQWYRDERTWGSVTPRVITVCSHAWSDAGYNHKTVREVWFDGQKARFQGGKAAQKQVLSICRVASKNNGLVSIDELKADTDAWGFGTSSSADLVQHIKRTVSDLKKRRFGQALTDEGDDWRLTADVVYRFEKKLPSGTGQTTPSDNKQKVSASARPRHKGEGRSRSNKRAPR